MRADSGAAGNAAVTVLYEDAALLVCVKPRGLLSASDVSGKPSLPDALAPRTIFPVHRLDREATGLIVYAKTRQAAAFLSAAVGTDAFVKEYLALCEAAPPEDEGILEDLLFHDRAKNKTYAVGRSRAGVKAAKLSYRVLRRTDGRALLQIRLYTGRTHQIRVQFASRGCPLCGDRKYGAKTGGELALYAWRLSFPHPNGEPKRFTLPDSFLPPELLPP